MAGRGIQSHYSGYLTAVLSHICKKQAAHDSADKEFVRREK